MYRRTGFPPIVPGFGGISQRLRTMPQENGGKGVGDRPTPNGGSRVVIEAVDAKKKFSGAGRQQAAAEWNQRNILPNAILFADEHQFFNPDCARPLEVCPAFAGDAASGLGVLVLFCFHNRHVRHVGPFFGRTQTVGAEPIMQFPHACCGVLDRDEHGRSDREESPDVSQFDLERSNVAAGLGEKIERLGLSPAQGTWRQNGEMGGQMGCHRMKFPAEALDKFPSRLTNVGDQRVASTGHDGRGVIIT